MEENRQQNEVATVERQSRGTIPSSVKVPNEREAILLGMILDRARAAMGYQRLPETEQDIAVVSWYEILDSEGVPVENWDDCYRSAQARRRARLEEGESLSPLSALDLAVEWRKLRKMHAELDRALPASAASQCLRCCGSGKEELADGTLRETCDHAPMSDEEFQARMTNRQAMVKSMREQLAAKVTMRPVRFPRLVDTITVVYSCSECGRKASSVHGWNFGDVCGARLVGPVRDGERLACNGLMRVG